MPVHPGQDAENTGGSDVLQPSRGAWARVPSFSWVRVGGDDAVRFVDSFTTASVASVAEGGGGEGFFTDVRGQVLTLAGLLRTAATDEAEPGLEIFADGEVGGLLAEHLERYHIRERLTIEDLSASRQTVAVLGPAAADCLAAVVDGELPAVAFEHRPAILETAAGCVPLARMLKTDWAGPACWLLTAKATDREALEAALRSCGLAEAGPDAWETARIEQGTPGHQELVAKTLPQELGRDARAISFTKGCYLGQETVARLDALGHVNRRLTGLVVTGSSIPRRATEVLLAGKPVGVVTSACFSPRLQAPLALAMLSVTAVDAARSGGSLDVDGMAARVIDLPLLDQRPADDA